MKLFSKFVEHPHAVGETYLQHMKHAQSYTWKFFELWLCTLIHSVFPWMFNGYISGELKKMHNHVFGRIDGK